MIGGMKPSSRSAVLDVLTLHRLGGDDLGLGVGFLETPTVAHQGAAGAEAGHRGADRIEFLEDLDRGAVVMRVRIRLVAVLVRHVVLRVLGHLERYLDGTIGTLGTFRINNLGSVHPPEQLGSARR